MLFIFIHYNPAKFAYLFSGDYELISLLLETPSGFAIFTMHGHHFNDPDALEVLALLFPCYICCFFA